MEDCALQISQSFSELQQVVNSLDKSVEHVDNINQMMQEVSAQMSKDVDSTPSPQWRLHNNAVTAALGKLVAAAHHSPSVFIWANKFAMALKAQWTLDEPRVVQAEQADAMRTMALGANLEAAFDSVAPTGSKKTKTTGSTKTKTTGSTKTKASHEESSAHAMQVDDDGVIVKDEAEAPTNDESSAHAMQVNDDGVIVKDEAEAPTNDESSAHAMQVNDNDDAVITGEVKPPASRRTVANLIAYLDAHIEGGRQHVHGDGFCADYSVLGALNLLEHRSPQASTVNDRQRVYGIREALVDWMEAPQQKRFRDNTLDGVPSEYLPASDYITNGVCKLDFQVYGGFNTHCAASAVLHVDIVSLDESQLNDQLCAIFAAGKQSFMSIRSVIQRIEKPTSTPMIFVVFNGSRGDHNLPCMSGHFSFYRIDTEEPNLHYAELIANVKKVEAGEEEEQKASGASASNEATTAEPITTAKKVEAGEEEEQKASGASASNEATTAEPITNDKKVEADRVANRTISPDSITAELSGSDSNAELEQLMKKLDTDITKDQGQLEQEYLVEKLKLEINSVRMLYGNTTSDAIDDIFSVTECDKHGNPLSKLVLYELTDNSDRWAVGGTTYKSFETMRISPHRSTKAKVRPHHHRFLHPCICTCAILRCAQPPCSRKF
jgi:hypothetical protein